MFSKWELEGAGGCWSWGTSYNRCFPFPAPKLTAVVASVQLLWFPEASAAPMSTLQRLQGCLGLSTAWIPTRQGPLGQGMLGFGLGWVQVWVWLWARAWVCLNISFGFGFGFQFRFGLGWIWIWDGLDSGLGMGSDSHSGWGWTHFQVKVCTWFWAWIQVWLRTVVIIVCFPVHFGIRVWAGLSSGLGQSLTLCRRVWGGGGTRQGAETPTPLGWKVFAIEAKHSQGASEAAPVGRWVF